MTDQSGAFPETIREAAWDSLIAVVTGYVSDRPVISGGDSDRAVILAAIERARAALERPRPAPPDDNDASRPVRDAAWQVVKELREVGSCALGSLEKLDRALGAYDSPGGSAGTGAADDSPNSLQPRIAALRARNFQRINDPHAAGTGAAPPDLLIQAAEEAANVLAALATRVKWGGISNVSRSEEDHWRKLAGDIRGLVRGGAAQPPPGAPSAEVQIEMVRLALDKRLRDYDFTIRDGTYPRDLAEIAVRVLSVVPREETNPRVSPPQPEIPR